MAFGSEVATLHPTEEHSMKQNHPKSQTSPAGQEDQQTTQVFVGKVVKGKDGRYGLVTDEATGSGGYLDNQEKVKEFEGKNVKVTGVLEVAKKLLHVTDNQPV